MSTADIGTLQRTPQPEAGICYAHKISKAQAHIDWTQSAQVLEQRIRAFHPFPGTTTYAPGPSGRSEAIKIRSARLSDIARSPQAVAGEVLDVQENGIHVACGRGADDGTLQLQVLQRAGGKALPAAEWLRGFALRKGAILGQAPSH